MKKKLLGLVVLCLVVSGCSSSKEHNMINATDVTYYTGMEYIPENYAKVENGIKLEIIEDTVDTETAGEYSITYKATDSTGKTAKRTIKVTVVDLNAENVLQITNDKINSLGLNDFKANINDHDSVFATGPYLSSYKINDIQSLTVYPEIYMTELSRGFQIVGIMFRFELKDTNSKMSDRLSLYANNKKATFNSNGISFEVKGNTVSNNSVFEDDYYISKFSYTVGADIDKLKQMVQNKDLTITVNTYENVYASNGFDKAGTKDYSFKYKLNENDCNILLDTINLYYELTNYMPY